MTSRIVKLTNEDIGRLVELESANQPAPWSERVFGAEIASQNRIYLAVMVENSLLAYGGVMVVGEEAHVLNLLVAPDQRRKGHATALLVELVDEAVAIGARHLTLEVRSRNQSAIDLYRNLGLAPVGVRPGYYGDDDALIMWAHDIDDPAFLQRWRDSR